MMESAEVTTGSGLPSAAESQEQMSRCIKLQVSCDKRNEHMPRGKIMT